MALPPESTPPKPARLRPIPNFIFMSRWLQLPLYLGLILAQCVYVFHFWVELVHLVEAAFGNQTALAALIEGMGYHFPAIVDATGKVIGQHDHGFGELRRLLADDVSGCIDDGREVVAHAFDQRGQRGLVAECGLDQVHQLDPEVVHVDALRQDQAEVERQLQPAAHEDEIRDRPQAYGLRRF